MRERETVAEVRPDPSVLGGGAEALELGVVMSMMVATNSGSEKRSSGGDKGRRGKR